ncbi:MAG: Fe-S protein [Mycobacterium sp.]|nr:Fe-S protein [Mycobacterium sp.]
MEVLRSVVVLLHIVGFAVTFGAWVAEAAARRFRTTRVMDYGLLVSLLTGLALAAPWPAGIELNYPKIGIKLVILVILGALLGMGSGRQKRTGEAVPRPLFVGVGVLAFTAAAIAVVW